MKLEVQPGNVIGDTVDAGKDAFQSIKRSRNGEEERNFSHKISYDAASSNAINITNCKKEMMEIISASELTVSQILTESSEVIEDEGNKSVQCSVKVVVTKNG
ncbi:hypothetical protein [Microbulbifer sp. A4B17]|uniref:hypothetical protein n=1 Tax=Microbulbifer sp. A4B17 TaxID=359370 RepID=UPI00130055F7|nr:hypothetical protein [Microbulbifer sp. A4B17]